MEAPQRTTLGKLFPPDGSGQSRFLPLLAGSRAFHVRSGMTALAERTLDMQYYIWEDDTTGRMLLHDVLHAAERGVRVRLLLDDVHTEGSTDVFAIIDAHPNIQVRLFNPFPRNEIRLSGLLLEGLHLNRRMHNKVMIADNALAVTGGRNIGDHYFAVDKSANFRDLDVLVAGPAIGRLSDMFDAYWNSRWSWPVAALGDDAFASGDAADYFHFLETWLNSADELPFAAHLDRERRLARIRGLRDEFIPGDATVVYDEPEKVAGHVEPAVAAMLFDVASEIRNELLIETAYFIPGDSGVSILASLVKRGVDVKVLTNSLATNDILAAHAGYAKFREPLLAGGIDLFELRPDALREKDVRVVAGMSHATLHTKALVGDRRVVLLGSFNLDPRSLVLNTEVGLMIESRALAARIADIIEHGMAPKNSYRLVLDDGDVRWLRGNAGTRTCLDHDPETGWWDRFVSGLMSLMPIEGQM